MAACFWRSSRLFSHFHSPIGKLVIVWKDHRNTAVTMEIFEVAKFLKTKTLDSFFPS